jgi:hypothetical protein
VLCAHPAHLVVTCLDARGPLTLACDLTKAIVALMPVTDSLAVCWMNGFALNPARTVAAAARDMFDTGFYPVDLWVAAGFNAEKHTLHTEGMTQFDAPEIILRKQPDPASLMVDYLCQVAQFVLTSPHKIKNGERMHSPHGLFRISLESKGERGTNRTDFRSSIWYIGTMVEKILIHRVQTGVRMEKRILKVLKGFAEFHDMSLGDLLEGIVLHAFDGKTPFSPESLARIRDLKKFYGLDLDSSASHHLREDKPMATVKKKRGKS